MQNPNGFWEDFDTLAGKSDEWVTAYTGALMAEVSNPEAKNAAIKAWNALVKRKLFKLKWGYNRFTPADADSTAWSLLLYEKLGIGKLSGINGSYKFLKKHVYGNGGVTTYSGSGPIRKYTMLSKKISFRGWCSEHTCVTAAAANLNNLNYSESIINYLKSVQNDDGSWSSYWWVSKEYATCLAIEALLKIPGNENNETLYKASAWLKKNEAGSAFCNSLKLFAMQKINFLFCDFSPEIKYLTYQLAAAQNNNGSWDSSAELRIPPPFVTNPDEYNSWRREGKGGGSIILDQNRVFTTITVLRALNIIRQA